MKYQFTAIGHLNDRAVTIVWNDGAMTGDAEAIAQLRELALTLEGKWVRAGNWRATRHNHLADPVSTRHLMKRLLGWDCQFEGTWPEPAPLPPGAVS